MPELPEVETSMRGIAPHISQQIITKVRVQQYQLRWPIPANIQQLLLGQTIHHLERRGKYLLLHTHTGTILIHLGMSGHVRILLDNVPPTKHDHIDVTFHNRKILRFTDPRKFGCFLWIEKDIDDHVLLKNLGVEPLTKDFSGAYLWSCSKNSKRPIKSLLMDNKIVTGIGNIYAAEALFIAGIHPTAPANSLSLVRLNKLVKASKQILQVAIKQGGTTLKDFRHSNGKPGYFSQKLKVYGREGLPCVSCKTELQAIRIGQRHTVYCKKCQTQV